MTTLLYPKIYYFHYLYNVDILHILSFFSFIEAKHEYFERLEPKTNRNLEVGVRKSERGKGPMMIKDTKLGVTLVLSRDDCKILDLSMENTTKEAVLKAREKLGLPVKKSKKTKK